MSWQLFMADTPNIDSFLFLCLEMLVVRPFLIFPDHQSLIKSDNNLSRGTIDQDPLCVGDAFLLAKDAIQVLLKHVQVHGALLGSLLRSFPVLHLDGFKFG